ncbi:MAG: 4Fe-4S binding protein [Methanolobus sp.]|nr:4Fe-4S binding protein [Methanolobus sp.]
MPLVNKKKCVSCKKCVKKCPVDAISMKKGKALINNDICINCGKCIRVCPVKAILKDREIVEIEVASNIKAIKNSLAKSKSKKSRNRMIKNRMRQIKMQDRVLRNTLRELKHLKL